MKRLKLLTVMVLALLFILPFWNYTVSLENYISFVPFVLFIMLTFFLSRKETIISECNDEIKLSDVIKASMINFFIYPIIAVLFGIIVMFFNNFFSKNVFLFVLYVLLLQNIVFITPGEKLLGIQIKKDGIKDFLSILICNLYYVLPLYSVFLSKEIQKSQQFEIAFCCIFLFYLTNAYYRFFVSHNLNLLEKVLKIKKFKINRKI